MYSGNEVSFLFISIKYGIKVDWKFKNSIEKFYFIIINII